MSKDKNVFIGLIAVVLFGVMWFAMFPKIMAYAAEQARQDVIECEAGYILEYLADGGVRITGDCAAMKAEPDEPDEPVYNYPYPVPDAYPSPDDTTCDTRWSYGQECAP